MKVNILSVTHLSGVAAHSQGKRQRKARRLLLPSPILTLTYLLNQRSPTPRQPPRSPHHRGVSQSRQYTPPKTNLGPSQHEVHPPTAYSMHRSASLVPVLRKRLSQPRGSSLCGCRAPKNPWRRLKYRRLGMHQLGHVLMCSCMGPSRILTFSSIVSEKMGTGDCDSLQMIVPLLLES